MSKFAPHIAKACDYIKVAVSKTTATANVSVIGDGCVGRDYLERVVVVSASTVAPGAVVVLDGDTVLATHNAQLTGYIGTNIVTYEIGVLANTTKGFNITTGTSVTALAIGRFNQ